MRLIDGMVKNGDYFFRWRSYLPLFVLPVLFSGFIGFTYPYDSYLLNLAWEFFCLLISIIGLLIRIIVSGTVPVGTSGRNTLKQVAAQLNTTGIYSVVRHPLYIGNFLIILGISMLPRQWYLAVIISLVFILYYERIIAREEAFLEERFGDIFRAWAKDVSVVVPHFKNYQRSNLEFSIKATIRKEFHSVFTITAAFFVLDLTGRYVATKELLFDPVWTAILIAGLSFYLLMMFLKKRTKMLLVEGR